MIYFEQPMLNRIFFMFILLHNWKKIYSTLKSIYFSQKQYNNITLFLKIYLKISIKDEDAVEELPLSSTNLPEEPPALPPRPPNLALPPARAPPPPHAPRGDHQLILPPHHSQPGTRIFYDFVCVFSKFTNFINNTHY